jgi:hypothetical protein
LSEAERIRNFLQFPSAPPSSIDPCVGDGVAFEVITNGAEVLRYGIELDAYRAEQARQRIPNIVQGNTLEVQCPVECFGLLYLNPPYDWTLGPADSRRTEQAFLGHTYRWLKPGGILLFVIPGDRLAECSQILATHFRDVRVFRLEATECVRYKQVVLFGVRRSRRERERLNDNDITRARLYYASLATRITFPESSGPVHWSFDTDFFRTGEIGPEDESAQEVNGENPTMPATKEGDLCASF